MTNQDERQDVIRQVKSVVSRALKVSENQITLESSLIRDLGAESIDFLDIIFQLEKTFKIKIPKGELFPEKLLADPAFIKEGRVTPAGIEQLKINIPYGKWDGFSKDPVVANLGEVFTVGMIVDYLSNKLKSCKDCN